MKKRKMQQATLKKSQSKSVRTRKKKKQSGTVTTNNDKSKIASKAVRCRKSKKNKSYNSRSFFGDLRYFIIIFMIILLSFIALISLFYSVKKVNGFGMMPTLQDKEVLFIKKYDDIKRFDMVLLNNGREGEFRRVIGMPGEDVRYQEDNLYINNQLTDEKFIVDKINENQAKGKNFTEDFTLFDIGIETKIPESYYLVLGDNRPYTTDSRDYGLVKKEMLLGKVSARLFPIERIGLF